MWHYEQEERCIQSVFGRGIPEGQRLFGRPRSGWENNIKRVKR